MTFLLENVIIIVSVLSACGALCAALELVLKRTRGVLAAISLVFNAVGIVLAFIGGMSLLTLVMILLAEFLIVAAIYAARA